MRLSAGRRWLAWWAGVAMLASTAVQAAGGQWPAGKNEPPVFALASTTGETLLGPLLSLSADGTVQLGGNKLGPLPLANWVTLRRNNLPLPTHPRGPQIVLTSGDYIRLADKGVVRMIDNQLHCQPQQPVRTKKPALEIPLSRVVVVWLAGTDDTDVSAQLLRQLLRGTRKKDIVLLRSGDKVEGNVTSLDSSSNVGVDTGKKQLELPWANIAAIAFSTELLTAKPPSGTYYQLVLADGARWSIVSPTLAQGAETLTGNTLFAAAVEVPINRIVAVNVRQGAAVYLSELKPRQYDHTPFVGTTWPLVADGSVTGGELRLAGSTFDKGLGMHAQSRVVYALDGQYRWFEALVGLDLENGKKGRVRIRVLVDGKEKDLGWNKELTAKDGALTIRVDVSNARELTLEVLFGGFGDVQAHVNWVDARLIKPLAA
jgi:hypothetical protein